MMSVHVSRRDADVVIIIPARFASARLPAKMLLAQTGKPMIQHVWENACQSHAGRVIVATDDERIYERVMQFGGEAMMTSPNHQSGTQRIAEAAEKLGDFDGIVINLQGDEPTMTGASIDQLIALQKTYKPFMSTLFSRFAPHLHAGPGSPLDPGAVKVILTAKSSRSPVRQALYFSRSLIPYAPHASERIATPEDYFLHSGIYAFTRASLREFVALPHSMLEKRECLEQLRAIEHGYTILACEIEPACASGIDTQEDYTAFLEAITKSPSVG